MSRLRQCSIASRGAPASSAQFHSSKGMAMPSPAMRSSCAGVSPARMRLMPSRDEFDGLARRRVAIGKLQHGPDGAEEIDQHQLGAAPADLQAEEERAFRVERHRDRGLADLAAYRLVAQQQAFVLQLAHDDGDGLRRQSGQPRDLGLGEAAMAAHQRQRQALIVVAHPALVGAAVVAFGDRSRAPS